MIDFIDWLLIYLCANCLAFLVFASDKSSARSGDGRVSEQTLLWMSFLGGVGAFAARRLLRHKTRKEPFRTRFQIVATAHVVAALLTLPSVWPVVLNALRP
jgi:uncharacterized membrane protein YsdA (DUF1294 family)